MLLSYFTDKTTGLNYAIIELYCPSHHCFTYEPISGKLCTNSIFYQLHSYTLPFFHSASHVTAKHSCFLSIRLQTIPDFHFILLRRLITLCNQDQVVIIL